MCDSVSRNTRARPAGAAVGEETFDQGGPDTVAPVIDEHLVEYRFRTAGFDRPTPGDHCVAVLGHPHHAVAVVDEQWSEAGAGAGVVERMAVDLAEASVQRHESVEIGGPGASDVHDAPGQPADEMARATTP